MSFADNRRNRHARPRIRANLRFARPRPLLDEPGATRNRRNGLGRGGARTVSAVGGDQYGGLFSCCGRGTGGGTLLPRGWWGGSQNSAGLRAVGQPPGGGV